MYFDINGQIPTSSMPLLMKGAVGEDAYSQIFIGSLGRANFSWPVAD